MKFWSPYDSCGVRINLRIKQVPGMVPGQFIERVETKVCQFKGGLYETFDETEIAALKLHHTYGGEYGTGKGAFSSGMGDRFSTRNAFFLMPEAVTVPKSALQLNPQLNKEVSERDKIIKQARTVGVITEFSNFTNAEIMSMIKQKKTEAEKVFEEIAETAVLTEMAEVQEVEEAQFSAPEVERTRHDHLSSRFNKPTDQKPRVRRGRPPGRVLKQVP